MANSTAASYKQLKEDFVSNLSGGSVGEICLVTMVAPVCFPRTDMDSHCARRREW